MRIKANVSLEVVDSDNKIMPSYATDFSREAHDKQSIEDGYMQAHSFALDFAESICQTCNDDLTDKIHEQFERSCI